MSRKVYLKMHAFIEICKFSAQYASNYMDRAKWVESMGYLFCCRDNDRYIIEDAVGISRGGETYVTMSPEQLGQIETLERERPNCFLGGWWHTHPGLSPFFSDTDTLNQMFYQAGNEDGLGLVFDHSMVAPDFVGFKIFRLDDPQDPHAVYHDVEWFPLDWTETQLEQAFQPIGISNRVIAPLAYKLGIRKAPPPEELPAFVMPRVASDSQAKQMIENTHTNAETAAGKKDWMQALVVKRVEVALLEQYGDPEEYADAVLEFVGWALQAGKFGSAEQMLARLEVMEEEKKFPEDTITYYTGKIAYCQGQIFQSQLRYSNAIEAYEKSIKIFTEEDYFEDCFKAAFHIAECYDFQKEGKKALEWVEKTLQFGNSAIEELKSDEETEEDDLQQLQAILTAAQRFQMRLKAKIAATSQGAMKIT
jgi:hypothetical protein